MDPKIEKLTELLSDSLPGCKVAVDAPARVDGSWWIDVDDAKGRLTLEFRSKSGFGIYGREAGYGEGPAEVYRTPELASKRITQLMKVTEAKQARLTLKDLRELYDCSQVELASKVGVQQSAISRFEQRSEVKLGTLAAAVKALGGALDVRAHFPDADVSIGTKD